MRALYYIVDMKLGQRNEGLIVRTQGQMLYIL